MHKLRYIRKTKILVRCTIKTSRATLYTDLDNNYTADTITTTILNNPETHKRTFKKKTKKK